MANYGLFPEGFVRPTVVEVRDQLEQLVRSRYGSLPMGDDTFLGFLLGIMAEQIALLWEALEALYASRDPDKASGLALRALGLFTGTLAIAAQASTAILTLCGQDGTVVNQGSTVATVSTEKIFEADEDKSIELLDSWLPTTLYAAGDRVTNSNRCYECIADGTSAGSGGPSSTSSDITDGTAHWRYIGEGEGAVDAGFTAVEVGPTVAIAGDLTDIRTPLPGWQSALNLEDAEIGTNEQTDEEFREYREFEIARPGTGTPPAIKADILAIPGVTACIVFFNNTDSVDGDGLPPHSTEILVRGGDDQDIWDTLWTSIPLGITTIGDEVGTVIDEEGISQTLRFTRPEAINVYSWVSIEKDSLTYAGDAAVETSIVTGGDERGIGRDVVASAVSRDAWVDGVYDVTEVRVYTDAIETGSPWAALTAYSATPGSRDVVTNEGRSYICITAGTSAASGGPLGSGVDIVDGTAHWRFLGAPIVVTRRQQADYDTSRTTVVATDGEP